MTALINSLVRVVEFREVSAQGGDGATLEAAMRAEKAQIYRDVDPESLDAPVDLREFDQPSGAFVVGYEDGQPVCCGGIKELGAGACEIKRVYVVPELRGRGVARQLLAALEKKAGSIGYEIVRLETGNRSHAARRLYETAGYVEIGNFSGSRMATYFAEKMLGRGR
jgi:GNAT superfamily N-acetyltransferase